MKKIMIIGVGWEQLPLFNKAKKMGYETIVTTTWNKNKINADKIFEVPPRNLEKLERIFLEEKPQAVIADECDYSMYAVAYLTDKYNLPGPGLDTLTITNNKHLQRKLVDDLDVLQPKYKLCWNFQMVEKAASEFNLPVVIKSIDNRGSIGVGIVKKESDIKKAWFNAIKNSHSRMCLVEQFIDGDVITFEGFYDSNKYNFLAVSTKDNYTDSDNVAKKLYYPGNLEGKVERSKLIKKAKEIIDKINLNFGFSHIEFIIEKKSNNIYFLEIANRGGGVHISNRILPNITGIDLNKKLLKLSLGEYVDLNIKRNKYKRKNLMYFIIPTGDNPPNIIKEKYKKELLALYLQENNGEEKIKTSDATDRAGVIILTGSSFKKLEQIGEEIEREIKLIDEEYCWS